MARSSLEKLEHEQGDAAPEGSAPLINKQGTIRSGRLKGLTMWHAIWVLSWPVLIESFLNALVGLVDTTLAASLSEAATDAVGAASYFLWFISLVGMALGVGVTALVARSRLGLRGRKSAYLTITGVILGLATAAGMTL